MGAQKMDRRIGYPVFSLIAHTALATIRKAESVSVFPPDPKICRKELEKEPPAEIVLSKIHGTIWALLIPNGLLGKWLS